MEEFNIWLGSISEVYFRYSESSIRHWLGSSEWILPSLPNGHSESVPILRVAIRYFRITNAESFTRNFQVNPNCIRHFYVQYGCFTREMSLLYANLATIERGLPFRFGSIFFPILWTFTNVISWASSTFSSVSMKVLIVSSHTSFSFSLIPPKIKLYFIDLHRASKKFSFSSSVRRLNFDNSLSTALVSAHNLTFSDSFLVDSFTWSYKSEFPCKSFSRSDTLLSTRFTSVSVVFSLWAGRGCRRFRRQIVTWPELQNWRRS